MFYAIGNGIYPLRWFVIGAWLLAVLACLPFLSEIITPFKTTGFVNERSKSTTAQHYINKRLGFNQDNQFIVMYKSKSLLATGKEFNDKIKKSLAGLNKLSLPYIVVYPNQNEKQISKDKHTAYAVIIIKSASVLSDKFLDKFQSLIKKPSNMTMQLGGEPIFVDDINKQTQMDLYKADFVASPVAIVTLIFVFGSIVSALIPMVLGGGAAIIILTTLYFLGHVLTLSIFTLNIALLLGLCLSLDYALFIISRFSDELQRQSTVREAVATTHQTAGKAIFFSGIAVFVSLSALFLFPINILFSMAVGGLVAVFVAVMIALTLLPAILSVLGPKIHLLTVRKVKKLEGNHHSDFWHWLAEKVVSRPLVFFFPILIFLLMLGFPFTAVKLGVSDYKILPINADGRRFYDDYASKFDEPQLTPISMLVKTKNRSILTQENINKIYNLATRLEFHSSIADVDSIVSTENRLTKKQYYQLYNMKKSLMPKEVKELLNTTTRKNFTVLNIVSKYEINSTKTEALIKYLEKIKISPGLHFELTGTPVENLDVVKSIKHHLPYAMIWVITFTYFILLILLRSVFLPLKAIIMTLLSLSACYGALVLVFQEGFLHQLFDFQAQGMLDITILVIIFCALFGFSMDYEVFLLSRIKEAYLESGDVKKSIVFGIEKSSRIITSAALIVIVICGSFFVADVLMVKAFGLGIAVAIFVDAFLIRSILVPATMALMKEWNWYLPRWLDKILPK